MVRFCGNALKGVIMSNTDETINRMDLWGGGRMEDGNPLWSTGLLAVG